MPSQVRLFLVHTPFENSKRAQILLNKI